MEFTIDLLLAYAKTPELRFNQKETLLSQFIE